MNFTNAQFDINGTSLQGFVNTTFAKLVKVFGAPTYGPDDASGDGKVTCEWCLKYDNDTIVTIYDYKEKATPMVEYSWHIGGTSIDAVNRVLDSLGEALAG